MRKAVLLVLTICTLAGCSRSRAENVSPGDAQDDAASAGGDASSGAAKSRDLDLELAAFLPGDSKSQDSAAGGPVLLQLELEGLTPDLRRMLDALRDKVIELPALRIRIKG